MDTSAALILPVAIEQKLTDAQHLRTHPAADHVIRHSADLQCRQMDPPCPAFGSSIAQCRSRNLTPLAMLRQPACQGLLQATVGWKLENVHATGVKSAGGEHCKIDRSSCKPPRTGSRPSTGPSPMYRLPRPSPEATLLTTWRHADRPGDPLRYRDMLTVIHITAARSL